MDSPRATLSKLLERVLGRGVATGGDAVLQRFERRCQTLIEGGEVDGGGRAEDGFVVQGPVSADTERSLACLRRLYARETIVLSTWQDSDVALLDRLRKFCDAVVLSVPPIRRGGSNRNLQIASTNAGLTRARELGVRTAIKMRTDTCLMSPQLFSLYRSMGALLDDKAVRAAGLSGRICVPQTYTKKYFPFHVSDIVMLGDLADLARYWNVPLDERELAQADYSWGSQTLERIGMEGLLPECYLGLRFAQAVGLRPGEEAMAAYWRLLRDYFIVVDDAWFDLYWLKRPLHLQPRAVDELVSPHFWQSLYYGLEPSAAVWEAELSAARREGASFAFGGPPRLTR